MNANRPGSCCTPASAPAGRADARGPGSIPVVNRCCGGRDLGPVRDDEGPSAADLARFNRETINCPKCQAEMFDEAELCLNCGHMFVETDRTGLPPWVVGTGLVLIGAFTLWLVL